MSLCEPYTTRYGALIREFPLRPIRTKKAALAATKVLDRLFRENYDDKGEEEYIYVLAKLLEEYESLEEVGKTKAFGLEVFKSLMQDNEMSQGEMAAILGVSQTTVSLILNGQRSITAEHARALGKRFKLNPGVFL